MQCYARPTCKEYDKESENIFNKKNQHTAGVESWLVAVVVSSSVLCGVQDPQSPVWGKVLRPRTRVEGTTPASLLYDIYISSCFSTHTIKSRKWHPCLLKSLNGPSIVSYFHRIVGIVVATHSKWKSNNNKQYLKKTQLYYINLKLPSDLTWMDRGVLYWANLFIRCTYICFTSRWRVRTYLRHLKRDWWVVGVERWW